jgi:hypothetical protein
MLEFALKLANDVELAVACCIVDSYFALFFKIDGHQGYVVFLGGSCWFVVRWLLVIYGIHAPTHNPYSDKKGQKQNSNRFTAFPPNFSRHQTDTYSPLNESANKL